MAKHREGLVWAKKRGQIWTQHTQKTSYQNQTIHRHTGNNNIIRWWSTIIFCHYLQSIFFIFRVKLFSIRKPNLTHFESIPMNKDPEISGSHEILVHLQYWVFVSLSIPLLSNFFIPYVIKKLKRHIASSYSSMRFLSRWIWDHSFYAIDSPSKPIILTNSTSKPCPTTIVTHTTAAIL